MDTSFPYAFVAGTDAADTKVIANMLAEVLQIEAISLVPTVTTATHGSNYITTTIETFTAAGASVGTVVAHTTNSSGGSALTADTPKVLTLTGTGKILEVPAGGFIKVGVAKAGTGPQYAFAVAVKVRASRVA